MATVEQVQTASRFLFQGIPWKTYLAMRNVPENQHVRMTYDRGDLEVMSPSPQHEQFGYVIGRLIDVWTVELNIDIKSCRTMTVKREDLERGFEPDNCYYVKNEPLVWDKEELDLATDPPPDLAVEVDLTRSSLDKMQLCAAFGVPEVWRYDGRTLRVYELGSDGQYQPRDSSLCFPQLPMAEVQRVLGQLGTVHETTLVRSFRDWVRATYASDRS